MSSEARDAHQGLPKWMVVLLVLLLLLALGAGGDWLWRRYDPFMNRHPSLQQALVLLDAARARPLTDEEFDKVLAILDANHTASQLMAIAVVQLEAGRSPERRGRAVEALERCGQRAEPKAGQAAKTAAARLKADPKGP